MATSYKNPWYNPSGVYGPEYYSTDAIPIEHAGCTIYQRIKGHVWDVVKDGTCISQRAGINGAKQAAEMFAATGSTRHPLED